MNFLRFFPFLGLVLLLCLKSDPAAAQADTLPAFRMQLSSGKEFRSAQLPRHRPVVLIYFAPDCDHCHTLLQAFFRSAVSFQKAEVVLVTFKPVAELATFERQYGTARFPNMHVGTEGTGFFLRQHFKLMNTPFTALFNKDRKLQAAYHKETNLGDLIRRVNALK